VAARFSLAEGAAAIRCVASGAAPGKVVLTFDECPDSEVRSGA